MNVWYINSILGAICLEEENDALCGVHFCPDGAPELEPLPRRVVETPLLQEAEEQLNEYFAGVRREFDLPLAAKGTPFQQAVWAQLRKIPYGEVRTYGQLAAALGNPKASRAVGSACHRNPLCIVVPCHRVIGADGSLTGYADTVYADRLALSAQQTGKARCALLAQCEQQLLESCTVVPLMAQQKRLLLANDVRDLVFDPFFPVLDLTWAKMS